MTVAFIVPTVQLLVRQRRAEQVVVEVNMTKRTYIKIGIVAALILGFVTIAAFQFRGGLEYSANIGRR